MGTLSNERRKHIVRSESKKKFNDPIIKAEKAFGDELEKLVEKIVPKWFTDEIKNSNMVYLTNNVDIIGMENDPDYDNYRDHTQFDCYNSYPCKRYENIKIKASKALLSKRKKVLALCTERGAFEDKLRNVLYSVNTDKKLLDHLPELSEYAEVVGVKNSTALIPIDDIKAVKKLLSKK